MKILHVPYCFYPDRVGGTEVYVESLARESIRAGDSSVIAAPGSRDQAYGHEGLAVRRFAVDENLQSLDMLYGEGDPVAAASFERVLDAERPEVVHLHALTSAISPRLAAAVHRRGMPLVFTYHTPTVSCPRASLLRWGKAPCSGELTSEHCTACTLQSFGLPRLAAEFVGRLPKAVGAGLAKRSHHGKITTALRMRSLIGRRAESFHAFLQSADRIVAVSAWVRDVLIRNQIPPEKILLCRHGLPEAGSVEPPPDETVSSSALRLVFVGRLEPVKGLDFILRVLKDRPQLAVTLDVYGIAVSGQEAYARTLATAAGQDPRVRLLPAVSHRELAQRLRSYDLLVVPSQGLETGPLVVLEAFAAGIPVMGSRLGGIAEWVEDGRCGRLLEASSRQEWRAALERLVSDRSDLASWRRQLPRPRSMRDVSDEMRALYQSLLGARV